MIEVKDKHVFRERLGLYSLFICLTHQGHINMGWFVMGTDPHMLFECSTKSLAGYFNGVTSDQVVKLNCFRQ
jgi:hypothetical protein